MEKTFLISNERVFSTLLFSLEFLLGYKVLLQKRFGTCKKIIRKLYIHETKHYQKKVKALQ